MSQIPAGIGRVPNLLSSQLMLRNITNTNVSLLGIQEQLATGQRINRTSDDPTGAALVLLLNDRLAQGEQRARNLDHASSLLNTMDQRIGGLSDLVLEAKTITSSQVGVGSDAETRALQAQVVSSLRQEVFDAMNADFVGASLFAGAKSGSPAFEAFKGGYRYLGDDDGLFTAIGDTLGFPLTIGADQVVGATSERIEGDVDLNPQLTANTFIEDLRGPMVGKELGTMTVVIDDGATTSEITVDLSSAETVGDVQDMIASEVNDAMGAAFLGVGISADRLTVSVVGGYDVTFEDGPAGSTASALGLAGVVFNTGQTANPDPEADLDPAVSPRTVLGNLAPAAAIDFGDIRIRNGPNAGTVTIGPSMSVGEFSEAVKQLDLGVELRPSANGDGLDIVNHVSGLAMAVEEVGGGLTATTLGVRSFRAGTLAADLNGGRGVEIAHGATDPATGLPDPAYNNDFEVTLSDGTSFTVDLTPADVNTIGDVLAKIEADAAAAGVTVGPGGFQAGLAADGNGIVLQDGLGGPDPISVASLNGYAAEDLGLLDAAVSGGPPATLTGADVAKVEVDSLFTTLLRLEQALEADDVRGITFAGGRLEADLDRVASAQALIGTRAARVETASANLESIMTLDEQIRSELRDTDFVEAASTFSLLQTQLQASLTVAAQSRPLTLIAFL